MLSLQGSVLFSALCFLVTSPSLILQADVMPVDRVGVAGQVLHRKCFECFLPECTVQLTPARYASITVDGQMRFYCTLHFCSLNTALIR